jgi:glycosyltransferase involved in cell wall biosynthesis
MRRDRQAGTSVWLFLPDLSGGGAERVTLSIAEGLLARGLDVRLVVGSSRGPLGPAVPAALPVADLGASRTVVAGLKLYLRLARDRPSVMIGAMSHSNVVVALVCKLRVRRVPCVVVEHNTLTAKTSAASRRLVRLLPRLCRVVYPLADRVAAVSSGVASDLAGVLGRSPSSITVLHNPVNYSQIAQRAKEPVQTAWPVVDDAEPVRVLAAGRLTRQKDFTTLLVAMSQLPPRFSLVILGDGEEHDRLTELCRTLDIGDRVRLAGFVDNPYPFMDRADVFVLSSRWEGLPTVLLEALAFTASIVSTDCPSGPREILAEGELGQLVPVGDAHALAAAILRAPTAVVPARAHARQRYDTSAAIDAYVDVIRDVASR